MFVRRTEILIPMNELIQKLEAAVLRRNSGLTQLLQPGLPPVQIRKELKRGGIEDLIESLMELYSWRNGTQLHGNGAIFDAAYKGGIVPPRTIPMTEPEKEFMRAIGVKRDSHPEHYHLWDLKNVVRTTEQFKKQAERCPPTCGALRGLVPFLWETGRGSAYIALEIESGVAGRVVKVETKGWEAADKFPVTEAYNSFEEFLKDAIRCNEENRPLSCLGIETKPVIKTATAVSTPDKKRHQPIPVGENTLVLRTDFTDEAAWKSLCESIQDPNDEFCPALDFVSNPAFDGLTAEQLPTLLPEDSRPSFALIVDRIALTPPNHSIQVIDLQDKPGQTFRVIPAALGDVANNLLIANMDFDEFSSAVDKNGVFRGFKQQ